jgi:hypothetical protein
MACYGHCYSFSCPTFDAPCSGNATSFTDDPVIAGVTNIRVPHMNELRTAVNDEQTRRSVTPTSFGTVTTSDNIRATHFTALKTAINNMVDLPKDNTTVKITNTYSVGANIRAIHINNLRDKLQELEVDCSCNSECGANLVCSCYGFCGAHY